jgi:hypothetical protein
MLEEGEFLELLREVTSVCYEGIAVFKYKTPEWRTAHWEISLAGEMLCALKSLNDDQPLVEKVLNTLVEGATDYHSDTSGEGYAFALHCARLAAATGSRKVALAFSRFVEWTQRVPDLQYPIDDDRWARRYLITSLVAKMPENLRREVECDLIEHLKETCEDFLKQPIFELLAEIGTRRAFAALLDELRDLKLKHYPPFGDHSYWWTIFAIVEREGFSPDMIAELNEILSKLPQESRIMPGYHRELGGYARTYKLSHDKKLYGVLEEKKMQFWDYWIAYPDL